MSTLQPPAATSFHSFHKEYSSTNFADNLPHPAHTQSMSVQPSRVHRQPPTGYWQSATCYRLASSCKRSQASKTQKMKKGAAILVQSEHNYFTINRISQKSNRKSEQFRGKIALFQPFFGQIGEVFHTLAHGFSLPRTCSAGVSLAVVRASPPALLCSLGPCPSGTQGMAEVRIPYAQGIRPPRKPSAIKYGGIPYRGREGCLEKANTPLGHKSRSN